MQKTLRNRRRYTLLHRCCLLDGELIPELVAPIIERIGSGCASNPMRVLIRLTAPLVLLTCQFMIKFFGRLGLYLLVPHYQEACIFHLVSQKYSACWRRYQELYYPVYFAFYLMFWVPEFLASTNLSNQLGSISGTEFNNNFV